MAAISWRHCSIDWATSAAFSARSLKLIPLASIVLATRGLLPSPDNRIGVTRIDQ
jgi:hypothetical protein